MRQTLSACCYCDQACPELLAGTKLNADRCQNHEQSGVSLKPLTSLGCADSEARTNPSELRLNEQRHFPWLGTNTSQSLRRSQFF